MGQPAGDGSVPGRCESGHAFTVKAKGNANPGNLFRYDDSLGGYIFNLDTTGLAAGTYTLGYTIGTDPTVHTVTFTIRWPPPRPDAHGPPTVVGGPCRFPVTTAGTPRSGHPAAADVEVIPWQGSGTPSPPDRFAVPRAAGRRVVVDLFHFFGRLAVPVQQLPLGVADPHPPPRLARVRARTTTARTAFARSTTAARCGPCPTSARSARRLRQVGRADQAAEQRRRQCTTGRRHRRGPAGRGVGRRRPGSRRPSGPGSDSSPGRRRRPRARTPRPYAASTDQGRRPTPASSHRRAMTPRGT